MVNEPVGEVQTLCAAAAAEADAEILHSTHDELSQRDQHAAPPFAHS